MTLVLLGSLEALSAAARIRVGRGGGPAFAVIGAVVVGIIVVAAIVGPKKQKMVNPATGLERQTLPVEESDAKAWAFRIAAGVLALAGMYCFVTGFFSTAERGLEPLGLFGGMAFGGALFTAYAAGYRIPACIGGGVMGLLYMLKPAFFPIGYLSTWQSPPQYHTLSYSAERHLYFVLPGALLMFFALLLFIRHKRQSD
jgi:hypothetical protein